VVTSVVQQRTFEQTLRTQGMVEAKRFALVSARVPGTLDAVLVDEGDRVRTGQALFGVDRLKLEKALEISRRDLAVAACGLREKQANLDRVQADFDKAELDYKRYGRLFEKKAVTADVFEAQESRYKQATASLKHAHVLVELGQEQLHQAEAAVEIAEKDLADAFERIAPTDAEYEHEKTWRDDNGHSHVRASLLGPSLTVPIQGGRMPLGRWQQVVLIEFDTRSRTRTVICQVMGE